MKKRILGLTGSLVFAAATAWAGAHGGVHWGYEGEAGPANWGSLSPDYVSCSLGVNQTPINITNTIEAELSPIEIKYNATPLDIVNNGHTVQVNYAAGSTITLDGHTFELLQFHFHTPSENHIDGKSYAMEAHLVHKDADGKLGVIAVMFDEGKDNPFLAKILENLPEKAGDHKTLENVQLNVADMLPANKDYYRFNGSLTTPPCTEGVVWLVMKNAEEMSKGQFDKMHGVLKNNNRPIQPVNARPVLK